MTELPPDGRPSVLMVDDSDQDLQLFTEAFRECGDPAVLQRAHSVEEARRILKAAAPNLILLDIQMGRESGFDLLSWIRAEGSPVRRVPVVMLTTTRDLSEIRRAYDAGANSFLVKPTGFNDLVELIASTSGYWLQRNRPA